MVGEAVGSENVLEPMPYQRDMTCTEAMGGSGGMLIMLTLMQGSKMEYRLFF